MKCLFALFAICLPVLAQASTYPVVYRANPFTGSLYFVPNDARKHTSIVMLHGSEGGSEPYIDIEAGILATQGFSVLALCYFDCDRGPTEPRQTLKDVEATLVLKAVEWLRSQPESNGKVAVYGFSRGAELTLIAGSLDFSQANKPDALIAHTPSDVFNSAYNHSWEDKACWLCRLGIGQCAADAPYSAYQWNPACGPDDPNRLDFARSAWLIRGINVPAQTRIPIEKFDRPILITVGEADEIWPVDQTRRVESSLKAAGRNAEVHYFPNEGHVFRGTDEIARRELVLDFLARLK